MTIRSVARLLAVSSLVALCLSAPGQLVAQTRPAITLPMPGITAFHPVTTTVAVGSDAAVEAMPALKRAGFDVVIVIREDKEEGYERQRSERAALDAGLRFIAIPFTRTKPDPAAVRTFLDVMAKPENSHAYVYCHVGIRASMMWMVKRVRQDGWAIDRAMAEAESLGLTRPELKKFAMEFLAGPPR